ncbi:MAG: hypothetical protein JSR00_07090 [Bacteroidetes bacterium]|nr:hypothetical protein [Bacteroidota bacterium]
MLLMTQTERGDIFLKSSALTCAIRQIRVLILNADEADGANKNGVVFSNSLSENLRHPPNPCS